LFPTIQNLDLQDKLNLTQLSQLAGPFLPPDNSREAMLRMGMVFLKPPSSRKPRVYSASKSSKNYCTIGKIIPFPSLVLFLLLARGLGVILIGCVGHNVQVE
jgi:hypothetical protein